MHQPIISITRKSALLFACFLVLYEFLTYIANDMIMPAMPSVVKQFHAPESWIATSLTAYILGGASLQLFLGPISDAIGRRPVMRLGTILFFIFTILIIFSDNISHFMFARFFQGMGLCFIAVIGYATIQEIFGEGDAIRLIAMMANVSIIAPLIGPLIGAVVVHYTSWHYIYIVIAFFSLIAAWGIYQFMPETLGQTTHAGHTYQPTPLSLRSVFNQYKALISNKIFMSYTFALGFIAGPCISWIALSPLMVITQSHYSIFVYAILQIPLFGACMGGNFWLQSLTHRYSPRQITYFGTVVYISGLLISVLSAFFTRGHVLAIVPGLVINFLGMSLVFAPLNRIVLYTTDVAKGSASAVVSLFIMIVQSLCIEINTYFYHNHDNILWTILCLLQGLAVIVFIFFANTLESKLPKKDNS
jgi:DHA1 family multidrug/chloramphenicol efflux transport protein-like MFS transporter